MKNIAEMVSTGRRKWLLPAVMGALAVTLGSGGAVMASTSGASLPDAMSTFTSADGEEENIAVREENGVRTYSTDGGMTWSETAPEGFVETEIDTEKILAEGGEVFSVEVAEDGTLKYSTDGGKTWSEEAPEGTSFSVTEDGAVNVMHGTVEK